jgi:hypothetical protein|nr:MAG TPA: hypothetical protein [Caudoviricetes sp.]
MTSTTKDMENLNFEFLDFNTNRKVGRSLGKNMFSVSLHGSASGILAFGSELKEEVERYRYLRLARQVMTQELYLVFNNEKGIELRERKRDGSLIAYSKDMAGWLLSSYFNSECYGRFHISENLANTVEYATYRITEPILSNK